MDNFPISALSRQLGVISQRSLIVCNEWRSASENPRIHRIILAVNSTWHFKPLTTNKLEVEFTNSPNYGGSIYNPRNGGPSEWYLTYMVYNSMYI